MCRLMRVMSWGHLSLEPGYNSIRSLAARLSDYQAVSGDLLSCLSLQLRLRGKSTTQSHRSAIYYFFWRNLNSLS